MNQIDQWPHKWFGLWHEYGAMYKNFPSINEFVFPDIVATYDKKRLRDYLLNAQIVASTSRASFPCPFTGVRRTGSISFRTNGEWLWLDDIPDYIDQYNVAIPSQMLRSIEKMDYKPQPVSEHALMAIEWPLMP